MREIRAAMTETRNAFAGMPARTEELGDLAARLAEIRDANVEHHAELVATAASAGVQVLGMGELFPAPYFALSEDPLWRELAEDATVGPTVTRMRALAREHSMVLVCPIYELVATTGKRFNTAVVIDADGEVLGRYRKTHIPHGTNERAAFLEGFYYERSDGDLGRWPKNVAPNPFFPVFETRVGRVGVAICYDRHFEGVMRSLAAGGAELVFSPAVTFGEKSRRMWELEFEVDAARHNLFIGGSNRRGAEPPWDVEYFGASYFAGPNGRTSTIDVHENLIVSDLDLDELAAGDPSGWNLGRDARPEIHSDPA